VPVKIDEQQTFFTKAEQSYFNARHFLNLQRFHFLLGQSSREGDLPRELRQVDIEKLDPGQYPQRQVTDKIRSYLMQRDGIREDALLQEIDQRLAAPGTANPAPTTQARPTDTPEIINAQILSDPDLRDAEQKQRQCRRSPSAGMEPLRRPRKPKPNLTEPPQQP